MNLTNSELETNLPLKVRAAQIHQVYTQTFLGLLANLVLAVMVVVVLWPVISPARLWGWFGLWFVVQSGRFILALKYRATNPGEAKSLRWGRRQTIGVALSGLVWGAAAIMLWPVESPLYQIFVPIVVVGLNAGATAGYAPLKLSYRLSLFLTLIPLSARFLYEGTTVHMLLAMTGILFLGMMYKIGHNLHQASTQILTIGFENEALVRKMEALNRELQTQAKILQENEARFQGLAQATFETIIIHRQGHILDVNQAATHLLGYQADQLIGRHVSHLISPEDQPIVNRQLESSAEEPVEVEVITKDGRPIPLEVRGKTATYQGQQVRVVAARDLTERKISEARRQRLIGLEERERIGRELHDDLGQVMAYVSLQAQAIRELLKHGQSAPAQAALTQLVQAAQEAHDNVRQYILGIRTSGRPPADFTETLQQYLGQLDERHGLAVHVSWPDDFLLAALAPEIETQLLRIIQEALTNVRKHAGIDQARIFFTLHPDEIQMIIADEGHGFKPYVVPGDSSLPLTSPPLATEGRIEEELSGSEPRKTEGHFGLEIMRERADAVGGSLQVRSTPDAGTQVIVRMPRLLSSPPEKEIQGMRVLLVDDHALYLEGLKNMLSVRGIQIVGTARDGLEAQELAHKLQPDLILMDVEMPRCNGLQATRRIKADLPNTKIVMLTVAADDETLFQALKNGASGYLLKSVEGREFFMLLNRAMQGETVLSPTLAARILTEFIQQERTPAAPDTPAPTLTPRQQEVLVLVAQGLGNKEIAAKLHVSRDTVKYHVSQILERLQLRSRYELAQYAHQQETGPPPDEIADI